MSDFIRKDIEWTLLPDERASKIATFWERTMKGRRLLGPKFLIWLKTRLTSQAWEYLGWGGLALNMPLNSLFRRGWDETWGIPSTWAIERTAVLYLTSVWYCNPFSKDSVKNSKSSTKVGCKGSEDLPLQKIDHLFQAELYDEVVDFRQDCMISLVVDGENFWEEMNRSIILLPSFLV